MRPPSPPPPLDDTWSHETGEALAHHLQHDAGLLNNPRLSVIEAVFEQLPHGISVFDTQLRLRYWNRRFADALGIPYPALRPFAHFDDLYLAPARRGDFGPGDPVERVAQRRALAERFEAHRFERSSTDGHIYLIAREPLQVGDRIAGFITTYTDITTQKRVEANYHYLAHHDSLTGLANRFSLQARLEQAITTARRQQDQVAVLFLDLDHFKLINDNLGHPVGDGLLTEVAHRLRSVVRESDTVARLGGDEFVLVLSGVRQVADVSRVADALLESLRQPYYVREHELLAPPSIGISLYPAHGERPTDLLRTADMAMYHAKASGRGRYCFYAPELEEHDQERLHLGGLLRGALARNEFELWYQPQIAAGNSAMRGFEALLRWRPETGDLIGPARFIPLADETGLIIDIGYWALHEACAQAQRWNTDSATPMRIAVNLSARQLRDPDLVERIGAILAQTGLASRLLELELTENALLEDPDQTLVQLGKLKALGVRLAVDGFGTGYSSLTYLKQLPLDRLKIDRSVISDIKIDNDDTAIAAAAISLAHGLGLEVIAEGVETAHQQEHLQELGCDELQGFHFSPPLPGSEAGRLLAQYIQP